MTRTIGDSFPPTNVLTVSAREYVVNKNKKLCDYDLVGFAEQSYQKFLREVPEGAEVVLLPFLPQMTNPTDKNGLLYFGTALIPKKKPRSKK